MGVVSDDSSIKRHFQLPGDIVSLVVSLLALPVISIFFWQRLQYRVPHVKRFTIASLTLLCTYASAWLLVFVLTALMHIRVREYNHGHCQAKIYACLVFYMFNKVTGFLFLIERAYVTSFPANPRHKTPEYIITCVGIFGPMLTVGIICLPNIIAYKNGDDICIIGIHLPELISFLVVEVICYFALTIRFLVPLLRCHFGGPGLLPPLKRCLLRTCIGSAMTMMSTMSAKISLTLFNGEPDWLCCMTCKIDVFIAVMVLHWVTVPEDLPDDRASPQALGLRLGSGDLEKNTRCGSAVASGGSSTSAVKTSVSPSPPGSVDTVELELEEKEVGVAEREREM